MLRTISTFFLILSILAGAGLIAWGVWLWPDLLAREVDLEIVAQWAWIHLYGAIGVLIMALIGYLLSFNPKRTKRPTLLFLAAFFISGGSFLVSVSEFLSGFEIVSNEIPIIDLLSIGMGVGMGLALAMLVLTFEWANRALWLSLAKKFDRKEMAGPALVANKLALMFKPGQEGMLRSVALASFRRGDRVESLTVLQELYDQGKTDPDILECLCKYTSEQHESRQYLVYLSELYELVPEEEEILEALINELISQEHSTEALQLLEANEVPDEEDKLSRYAFVLMRENRISDATIIAEKLGKLEGIPFRQSQALLRDILSRTSEFVPALNALAHQAERMALKEQRIRWLEKSLEANPSQDDVRLQLIHIYRELGQTIRLEELLSDAIEKQTQNYDLQIEYIQTLQQNGKVKQALALLNRLNKRQDAPAKGHFLESKIHFETGNLEKARISAEQVMTLDHNEENIRQSKILLTRIERALLTEEVVNILEEAKKDPQDLPLQLEALNKLIEGEHNDKMVELVDRIITHHPTARLRLIEVLRLFLKSPNAPFPILNLQCDLLANEGLYEETLKMTKLMLERSIDKVGTARDAAQRILRRSPNHLPTIRFLGDIYRQNGRFTDMIHNYSLYLAKGGEETNDILLALAQAYLSLEDYENSKPYIKRLLEEDPKNTALIIRAIPLALRDNEPEDAAEYLKKLEMADPRHPDLRSYNAKIQSALGQQRFEFLKQEMESGKGGSETLEKLGDTAYEIENFHDAITYFQRASRDKEDPSRARRCKAKLARTYMQKNLDDLCTETLREISITMDDPEEDLIVIMDILYEIAEMYQQLKHYDRADKIFKQLCKIDAGYRDVLTRIEGLRH